MAKDSQPVRIERMAQLPLARQLEEATALAGMELEGRPRWGRVAKVC